MIFGRNLSCIKIQTVKKQENLRNSQINKEIEAGKKELSPLAGIGNEAVNQILNGELPSGDGDGNDKQKSLLVNALTDPELSNQVIKDIILPQKANKAENQNKPVPQVADPQEIGGLYEDMIAYQECFGEDFNEEDLFKNDNPYEIDTRSVETRKRDILEAYKAKKRKEREEKAKKEQSENAKPPIANQKAGAPEEKKELNNKPVPPAAVPQKKKPLLYQDPENVRLQEFPFETEPGDDLNAELDPNESQEVSYLERRSDGLDDDLLVRSDMMEIKPEKKSKKSKKSPDRNQEKVEKDMYPVKDWNFTAQKMEDVNTISGFAKFRNKLGRFFSSVFGFITSGFGIKQAVAMISRYGTKKEKKRDTVKDTGQERSFPHSRLGRREICLGR